MRCLADTNVVLRFVHVNDPQHGVVSNAVHTLILRGDDVVIVPQVIYELWSVTTRLWSVTTRPREANGLGWAPRRIRQVIDSLLEQWLFLPDPPQLLPTWLDMVARHAILGKPAHDARLAAAATVHELDALLTLNAGDFKRFGLNVLTPVDL